MNNFFRALIAGYGAKKLGGGCFGTVIVFIIIWVALGQCSWSKINENEPASKEIKLNNSVQSSIERPCVSFEKAA